MCLPLGSFSDLVHSSSCWLGNGLPSQRAAIAKMVCAQLSTLNQWRSEGRWGSWGPGAPGVQRRTTWVNF